MSRLAMDLDSGPRIKYGASFAGKTEQKNPSPPDGCVASTTLFRLIERETAVYY